MLINADWERICEEKSVSRVSARSSSCPSAFVAEKPTSYRNEAAMLTGPVGFTVFFLNLDPAISFFKVRS